MNWIIVMEGKNLLLITKNTENSTDFNLGDFFILLM